MKTALLHDWLVGIAGGEKVLSALYEIYPSPIFTLLKDEKALRGSLFEKTKIHTSFIQKLPFARSKYRNYLPLFPLAIEQFNLQEFDLIISSSHCVAKGVLTHANQLHICYCHTPLRYGWDLYHAYLKESNLRSGLKGIIAKIFLHYLRIWDHQAAARVDEFIANSQYVALRIKKTYGRTAKVIYPPIDTDFYRLSLKKENYYVTASRMVPYKKMDLIVEAFAQMPDKRLIVIGDGPERKKIEAKAKKNVEFLGYVSDEVLKEFLQTAKAFVFAALEDFGIVPMEAMSCGTPVIAFNRGGIRETLVENQTGLFFQEQTVPSIIRAVQEFEKKQEIFAPLKIRHHALSFSKKRFQQECRAFIEKKYQEFIQGKK